MAMLRPIDQAAPAPVEGLSPAQGAALLDLLAHGPLLRFRRHYGVQGRDLAMVREDTALALARRGLAALSCGGRRLRLTDQGRWYAATLLAREADALAQALSAATPIAPAKRSA